MTETVRSPVKRVRWPLRPRGDLHFPPFPRLEPAARNDAHPGELYLWATTLAERAIDWYLRDKALKRLGSRVLRATAIVLGATGGLVPLFAAARTGHGEGWGYVLLATAAGCIAFDHFFGLSSAWMRNMKTVQLIQRRLTEFQLKYRIGQLTPDHPNRLAENLSMIEDFVTELLDLIEGETSDWLTEFRTSVRRLSRQSDWSDQHSEGRPLP
jgi:hypothetical protein